MAKQVLFGVPVEAATMLQVVDAVDVAIRSRVSMDIGVVNAAKIVNIHRSDELRNSVFSSDVIYADGMSVVWASRILRRPLPERVAGIDLMHAILERGNIHGYRVFCLGARQEILDEVVKNFAENYPGVTIAGARNGYFTADDEESVAKEIRDANPDVLFVAITSPKKENFMARWSDVMQVPVVHGVGGSFDVVAGLVDRAPESWQRLGLEWLYRVKQEPGRLWKRYLVTNSLFLGLIVREFFKGIRAR
jgi:N-acetylglucosaminyldiphosphoundecaprenol N-acetyl-beta-D-mannosaminyltransferase